MTEAIDRYDIERVILDTLRAAEARVSVLAGYLPLGASGVRADLAVWADEWIGFAISAPDDPVDDAPAKLKTYARHFDRVALVAAPCRLAALRSADLSGAALWSVHDGALVEHVAGTANRVGVSALLDLVSAENRRRLLRPLIPTGPSYDRDNPPITPAAVRAYVERVLAAEHGATAALLRAA